MEEKQQNNLKKVIIVLLILLLVSITALAGVKIYKNSLADESQSVTVHDNIITPDKQQDEPDSDTPAEPENNKTENRKPNSTVATQPQGSQSSGKKAAEIRLHKRSTSDNVRFNAPNMFPGDVISGDYCVRITHEGKVPVYFDIDVRSGYEKLAEVMKCKVTLVNDEKVIYDGFMKDFKTISKNVNSSGRVTTQLVYRIEPYLDTSVGNEYQNLQLAADFEWWVENEENLRVPADTGDITNTYMLTFIMVASALCVVILVLLKRKKEDADVQ